MGSRHGLAGDAGAGLAGPPRRERVRATSRPRAAPGRAHRPRARPLLRGAEDHLAARERHPGRGRDHHRRVAATPAVRGVRHRCRHRVPLTAARPRRCRLGTGGHRPLRRRGRRAARDRHLRPVRGHDGDVRHRGSRGGPRGRPTGRPVRRGVSGGRRGQVHVWHRRVPARNHRPRAAPIAERPRGVHRLAAPQLRRWAPGHDLLPRRPGVHRWCRPALAHRGRRRQRGGRPRPDRRTDGRHGRGDLRTRAGRPRSTVLGAERPRRVHRPLARNHASRSWCAP